MQEGGPSGPVAATTRPVFVDASGRRSRWIRRLFWALGLLVSAYIAVVFLALIGPPSLSRLAVPGLGPVLPGSGAPALRTTTGVEGKPASVLSPRPSARPQSSASPSVGGASDRPSPRPTGSASVPTTGGTPPGGPPSPSPTSAASPRPTGPPTSPGPRSSQTPPGQASGHPSPHSTHARGGSASPSPSP